MREKIIDKVIELLNTNIENIELTANQLDEDLTQLGIDSISFIRIIVTIEDEFDIEIPDEKLLMTEMDTISKIVDVITIVLNSVDEEKTIGK